MIEAKRPTQEQLNRWYETTNLGNSVYAIFEPHHGEEVFCYLVKGGKADMLIDTGMGVKPLKPALKDLLEPRKELFVINTHGHFDHIGANSEFPDVFSPKEGMDSQAIKDGWTLAAMNKYDVEEEFRKGIPEGFDIKAFNITPYTHLHQVLEEGVTFDLGGREMTVVDTPGHTWGSISLLDTTHVLLFSSDLLYQGPLYCFDYDTSYSEYVDSLHKLKQLNVKLIHPGHNFSTNSPELIDQALELFERAADPDEAPDEIVGRILTYKHPTVPRLALIISTDKLPNLTR